MPENNSPTPERDLLRIIEEQGGGGQVAARGSMRRGLSLFSLGALKGRLSFLSIRLGQVFSGGVKLEIGLINKLLLILAFVMTVFVSFDFVNSMLGLNDQVSEAFKLEKHVPRFAPRDASPLKSPSFYLEKARKRDIFKMVSQAKQEEEVQQEEAQKTSKKTVLAMTENLRLVGISWSDDPDVMIEDTKVNKTYFLKRGDSIGEVNVSAILKDRVMLSYQGEEVELK